jgi:biopolymer transport protein ExbD
MAAKVGGGGGGRYDLGQNSDINVTPFVDIMLVLLIVFMVSIPAATLAIKVDLPPATVTNTHPKPPTFITMYKTGQIAIHNGEHGTDTFVTLDQLAGGLVANLGADAQTQSILIRADRQVRYGAFMAVVNQLQADGFFKVSLITEGNGGQSST